MMLPINRGCDETAGQKSVQVKDRCRTEQFQVPVATACQNTFARQIGSVPGRSAGNEEHPMPASDQYRGFYSPNVRGNQGTLRQIKPRPPAQKYFVCPQKGCVYGPRRQTAKLIRRLRCCSTAARPGQRGNIMLRRKRTESAETAAKKPVQPHKNIPTQLRRTKAGTKEVPVPKMLAASMCGRRTAPPEVACISGHVTEQEEKMLLTKVSGSKVVPCLERRMKLDRVQHCKHRTRRQDKTTALRRMEPPAQASPYLEARPWSAIMAQRKATESGCSVRDRGRPRTHIFSSGVLPEARGRQT